MLFSFAVFQYLLFVVASVEVSQLAVLYDWLCIQCPIWFKHKQLGNFPLPRNKEEIVSNLIASFSHGFVLCELSNNYGNNVKCETVQFRSILENKNLLHFSIFYQLDLSCFEDDYIALDYLEKQLRPLLPSPVFKEMKKSSNAIEEFIQTEKLYVEKVLYVYHYLHGVLQPLFNDLPEISHNKQQSLMKIVSFKSIASLHQKLSLQLEYEHVDEMQRLLTYFDYFTRYMEAVYQSWLENRCDDADFILLKWYTNRLPLFHVNEGNGVDTLVNGMLIPFQRLCKYPLLLDGISKHTKDERFKVLKNRLDKMTKRLNDIRRTVDIHHKIANWNVRRYPISVYDDIDLTFLQTMYIKHTSSVRLVLGESNKYRERLLCKYGIGILVIKEYSLKYYIAGFITIQAISEINFLEDNILQLVVKGEKLILHFEKDSGEGMIWYDLLVQG